MKPSIGVVVIPFYLTMRPVAEVYVEELLWLAGFALTAGLVRRYLGFGFALVFIPLASFKTDFDTAVHLGVLIGLVTTIHAAIIYRHTLQIKKALGLKFYALFGVAGGALLATQLEKELLGGISLMAILISLSLNIFGSSKLKLANFFEGKAAAGIFSGALNNWTGMGGPPVVMHYNSVDETPEYKRGALTGYLLLLTIWTVLSFFATEQMSTDIIPEFIVGSVAVVFANFAGKPLLNLYNKNFAKLVEVAIAVTVVIAILKLLADLL